MFPHQELFWIIGCVFNTPCPTCAFSMLWSCIAHCHLLHTPLLPLSCIGLYRVSSSQHVVFTLCFVAFCFVLGLSFIFSFIITFMHHYHWSYLHLLPLFLLDPLSIRDKKGESILQRVYRRGLLCTSLGGEILFLVQICRGRDIPQGRCIFQGGEDIVLIRKLCFIFFSLVLLCPCWILYPSCNYFSVLVLVQCWTCIHPYAIVLCMFR